jgi:PilZ domain
MLAREFMHSSDHTADRRRSERVPVDLRVKFFAASEPRGLAATAVDLSWNGVRIRGSGYALEPGDALELVLMSDQGWERRSARVVWVEQITAGQGVEAGLEFRPAWVFNSVKSAALYARAEQQMFAEHARSLRRCAQFRSGCFAYPFG